MTKDKITNRIRDIFEADQDDRRRSKYKNLSEKERWRTIEKRDRARRRTLAKLTKETREFNLRGVDYFRMGTVFQHGKSEDVQFARVLADKGVRLGHNPSKWLYATTIDIDLIAQGKKQRYGTQFGKKEDGSWFLLPVDSKTTDSERRRYRVRPMSDINKVLDRLNKGQKKDFTKRVGLTRM